MAMNGEQSIPGAPSGAATASQYPIGTATRANPYPPPTTSTMPKTMQSTMTTPAAPYLGQSSSFRPAAGSQAAFPIKQPVGLFDRDATKPIGTPFGTTPSPPRSSSVLIRRLPLNTSEEQLRLMAVWSQDLVSVEVLPVEQSIDQGFRAAIMCFKSQAGAQEAKAMLDGKSNIANDADMVVDILTDPSLSASSTAPSSAASSTVNAHQPQRFNGAFQALDNISPPINGGPFMSNELPTPHSNTQFQTLFSPRSPIGNHHIGEATRISGKSLIKSNDVDDEEETGELLMNAVPYADNNGHNNPAGQRRSTVPQDHVATLMAGLSLNTSTAGPSSMPQYAKPASMGITPPHPNAMSPVVGPAGRMMPFQQPQYPRHSNYPPANPADQNPPCNTLYVGNLPANTSEEELKAIFSKQRGYKRLCFRTKHNGPMCFVEFEDISFATKALHELYGQPLHNSIKGGIRLSFSKNPLGVRSSQNSGQGPSNGMGGMNGMVSGSGPGNGFTSANGPPPGLSVPPGLPPSRMGGSSYGGGGSLAGHLALAQARPQAHGYTSMASIPSSAPGGWNGPGYNSPMATGGAQSTVHNSPSSNFLPPPPHMMGL